MSRILLFSFVGLFLLSSCIESNKPTEKDLSVPYRSLSLKYARGFSVQYFDNYKLVTVRDWKDTSRVLAKYVLSTKEATSKIRPDELFIQTPVRKVVCISTTHMAEIERLNLADCIAGVTGTKLIYSTDIQQRLKSGSIVNLGNEEIDYERLVALAPSFVISSGGYDGGDKVTLKLHSLNILSVLNLDYMEQDPLARAEWLKYIAVFFDRETLADSLFADTESRYLALKSKIAETTQQPKVFCNLPFKEIWYMPCGENYMARLIADAGGDFIWKETKANNGLNLNLDYEAVYNRAADADVWINTGFARSLNEIKTADNKNVLFKAWETGRVYNNNRRNTAEGGFDFWESGMLNPDLILSDLIAIFHPELMPGYELYYYQQLR